MTDNRISNMFWGVCFPPRVIPFDHAIGIGVLFPRLGLQTSVCSFCSLYKPWGFYGTLFNSLIKFFLGKRFARKPWGHGDRSSRLPESLMKHQTPNEHFACFPLKHRKLCGDQVLLGYQWVRSTARFLGGSHKWMDFQGCHKKT